MTRFHVVRGTTGSEGADGGGISGKLGKRHGGGNNASVAPLGSTGNLGSSRRKVADNITHVAFGSGNFDLHNRLKDDRASLLDGVLESHTTGDLEGHLGRVDLVERAVDDGHV